ncbi:MAG: hypothetical protein M1839_000339 [Geoglossum umbratile]|nr:MAG: hypothetical protein M1839_000339 [Geoglossum umbratile]
MKFKRDDTETRSMVMARTLPLKRDLKARLRPVNPPRINRLSLALFTVLSRARVVEAINSTLPNASPEDHERNVFQAEVWTGGFNWRQWSSVAINIRSGKTLSGCLIALGDTLSVSTDLQKSQYSAASSLLSVMPTLAAFLGGENKDLWVLLKLAPICGILDCLLAMGGRLVPDNLNNLERQVGGLGFADTLSAYVTASKPETEDAEKYHSIDVRPRLERNMQRRLPGDCHRCRLDSGKYTDGCLRCPCDWTQEIRRVQERVSRDQSSNEFKHVNRWVQFNAFFMFLMFGSMLVTMWIGELGGILVAWCNCSFWMFGWWFAASLNTLFTTYCNQPFRKVWRIRATVMQLDKPNDPVAETHQQMLPVHLSDETVDEISSLVRRESPPKLRRRPSRAVEDKIPRNSRPFCILVTVRGVSNFKMILRQVSRILTGAVFLIATGWLSSATLLPFNISVLLVAAIGASALLARFGMESIVRAFVRSDACVHLPVASDENAIELLGAIARIPGVLFEVEQLQILDGKIYERSWRSRWTWIVFGLLL